MPYAICLILFCISTLLQLESHSLNKRCHMVQQDGQMVINKVTTVGEVREETMQ